MRSTDNKLLEIAFNQGLNQSVGRVSPVGSLATCQNFRLRAGGTLEKRAGTRRVVGTSNIPFDGQDSRYHTLMGNGTTKRVETPCVLGQIGNAVLLGTTAGDAFCLDSDGSSELWHFQGCFSTCLPVRARHAFVGEDATIGFGAKPPACAVNSLGYILVAAVRGDGNLSAYIENPAGVRIWAISDASTTTVKVQVLAVGAVFYLLTQTGVTISVVSLTLGASSITGSALTTVGTLNGAGYFWDSSTDGTNWFLVHQDGAATLRIDRFTTITSTHNASLAMTAGVCPCSIWASVDQAKVWVGYYDDPTTTGNVGYAVYLSADLTLSKAATTIVTGAYDYGPPLIGSYYAPADTAIPNTTTAMCVFRTVETTGTSPMTSGVRYGRIFNTATAPSVGMFMMHVLPVSKPDQYGRVWLSTESIRFSGGLVGSTRQSILLVRIRDYSGGNAASPIVELSAPVMESFGDTYDPVTSTMYWGAIATGSTRSYFAFPFVLQKISGVPVMSIEVYEYTTGEQERHRSGLDMGPRFIAPGVPVELYGQSTSNVMGMSGVSGSQPHPAGSSEIGFPQAPFFNSMTQTGSTGPAPKAGDTSAVYSYKAVYEWVDVYGRLHRSAPSDPWQETFTSQKSLAISVSSLSISQRMVDIPYAPVSVHFYRTLANGTTYRRLPGGALCDISLSGIAASAYTDSYTDAQIAANASIYTDGGVLANDLAPSCRFLCKAEDRVWFGGLWDNTVIQCSKVIVPDEPIQCTDHDSHKVQLLADCTGLAYMDGTVIAFCQNSIYAITGDGPNDQGVGAFPPPRLLSKDIGCIDYKSILETSIGVFFQSALGLYVLPIGLGQPQYIGAAVRAQVESTPQCISATVTMTSRNHLARWLMGTAGTQTGTTIITFDLNSNQWFVDTTAFAMAEIGYSSDESGAVLVRNSLDTTSVTYPVWIESTTYTDDENNGQYDAARLVTNWIYPFGLGGWGLINKVIIAFEQAFGVTSSVTVSVNIDDYATQSATWSITGGTGVLYRMMEIINRKGTAVQITITDNAAGAYKPISATFEVEPSGGVRQMIRATEVA